MSSPPPVQQSLDDDEGDDVCGGRRRFLCREWAFGKLAHCLDQRPGSKTCGALVVGGPGCGKTAFFQEIVWPTAAAAEARQHTLCRRVLAHHFCQAHDTRTLAVPGFVLSLVRQLCRREEDGLLTGYQDRLRDGEAAAALEPAACARWPDEAFKKAVLFPLLEIDPPGQPCLLLVDSVDESLLVQVIGAEPFALPSCRPCSSSWANDPDLARLLPVRSRAESASSQVNGSGGAGGGSHHHHHHRHRHHRHDQQKEGGGSKGGGGSRTVAELLAAHQQLFPQWLLLVCSARKQSKTITRMFTGFRKVPSLRKTGPRALRCKQGGGEEKVVGSLKPSSLLSSLDISKAFLALTARSLSGSPIH